MLGPPPEVNSWLKELAAELHAVSDSLNVLRGQLLHDADVRRIASECATNVLQSSHSAMESTMRRIASECATNVLQSSHAGMENTIKVKTTQFCEDAVASAISRIQAQATSALNATAKVDVLEERLRLVEANINVNVSAAVMSDVSRSARHEEKLHLLTEVQESQRLEMEALERSLRDDLKNCLVGEAAIREDRLQQVETRMGSNLESVVVAEVSGHCNFLDIKVTRCDDRVEAAELKWSEALESAQSHATTRFHVAAAAEAERQDRAFQALRCNAQANELLGQLLEEQSTAYVNQITENRAEALELQRRDVSRWRFMEEYQAQNLQHTEATERRIASVSSEFQSLLANTQHVADSLRVTRLEETISTFKDLAATQLTEAQRCIEELRSGLKTHTHELQFDGASSAPRQVASKPVPVGPATSAVRSLSMATATLASARPSVEEAKT